MMLVLYFLVMQRLVKDGSTVFYYLFPLKGLSHDSFLEKARLTLSKLLAFHLGIACDDIVLKRTKYNKPYLVGYDLFFNLSHSLDQVAICLSYAGPVGIDIEHSKNLSSIDRLAKRFFHPKEIDLILSSSDNFIDVPPFAPMVK